ncbi:MAG: cell cycle transcriptional regulator TrcR [Hyphomonadaceae bacterium]
MTQNVLMPKATAVWLIENTSLAFDQIADFCGLHPLEVQGIANEDVAKGIRGVDPIAGGFLSREEIAKGEADEKYRMKALEQKRIDIPQVKKRGARYTPIARRGDRPDAIQWFLKNHPEIPDSKIVKLIGTTKATIDQVRNRTHWNASQIKPVDPVSLGLCSQIELDRVVSDAAAAKARADARASKAEARTLKTAQETVPPETYEQRDESGAGESS